MSHFYAEIQGNKGVATRIGNIYSGIQGHIKSWNEGIHIKATYDDLSSENIYTISITKGSNGNDSRDITSIFKLINNKVIFTNPDIQILNELSEKRQVDKIC